MSLKDKIKSNLKSYQKQQFDMKEKEYQEFVKNNLELFKEIDEQILDATKNGKLKVGVKLYKPLSFDNDFYKLKKYYSKEDVAIYTENQYDDILKYIVCGWDRD